MLLTDAIWCEAKKRATIENDGLQNETGGLRHNELLSQARNSFVIAHTPCARHSKRTGWARASRAATRCKDLDLLLSQVDKEVSNQMLKRT